MNHHSKLCELLDQLSNWQLKPEQRQTIFNLESKIVGLELAAQLKDKQIKSINQSLATAHQLVMSQAAQIARLTQSVTNMGETLTQLKSGSPTPTAYDCIVDKVLSLENAIKAEAERQRQRDQESLKSDDPIDEILENLATLNAEVAALKKAKTKRTTTPRRSTVKKTA